MGDVNQSVASDFILVSLFSRSGSHQLFFSLVAAMFIMGLLGNTLLLFLIHMDSRLHTPMYLLLSQLSLFDIGFPLVTIPKMASDFLQGEGSISFGGCAAQIFFLMLMGVAEGILLALMSYDRYVAVCHPLQYPLLMRRQVCLLMVGFSWLAGVLNASIQTSITLHFPYCASRIVDHFFCEVPALLKLSCADTSAYELALSTWGVLILVLPLSLIATSYGHVLGSVLRMRPEEARSKALTTCSSHITVVGLFYGAAVFMYMVPGAYHSPHQDNMVSLFYSLVTPTLNPVIYSLRNREVRMALVKVLSRAGFRPE
ncbi:olfactory receptor 2Z1-like [Diceros bicornis minor]|uniref:olfactory receptor 2Z1 n=1 Tax=Diceros bicornis minor TaxID=77932 RepID=UPI0026F03812|nr:olfactory receptor 2Z1 [Diceros bicornis minor]XP_058394073.1 olfactory receptor 2Z1-like [Diceros bicornis minor]XP_058394086.1 olfactory receptor 2Z1-like [Diceros bicornis minor]